MEPGGRGPDRVQLCCFLRETLLMSSRLCLLQELSPALASPPAPSMPMCSVFTNTWRNRFGLSSSAVPVWPQMAPCNPTLCAPFLRSSRTSLPYRCCSYCITPLYVCSLYMSPPFSLQASPPHASLNPLSPLFIGL